MSDHQPKQSALVDIWLRRLGVAWVCVSLPVITAAGYLANTPRTYVFVLVFMACGAYTTPALLAGWHAARRGPRRDAACYWLLYLGLVSVYLIGVAMMIGLATGWRWANPVGIPAVVLSGGAHLAGLALLVRSRSGSRSLSVDFVEMLAAVVALTAPLVLLFGEAVVEAEHAWFAVPSALAAVMALAGTYWTLMLFVRLGPGRGMFELSAVCLASVGTVNASLQTANAVSGFSFPAPPLMALNSVCFSMYLLLPLHVPLFLRKGLAGLPLRQQLRGGRLATLVPLVGLVGLLVTTTVVASERSWAVPFALGTVALLCGLGALRQLAAVGETRRLHRLVEESAEQRRLLLTEVLERSAYDRRRFASKLYEQAVAAYTSFSVLTRAEGEPSGASASVARASALVGDDLARQAESVRELVLAIRPFEVDMGLSERLRVPIKAYLATLYDNETPPQLSVRVADELRLDWVVETLLLQVMQESLGNVARHSDATSVTVTVEVDSDAAVVSVSDDGAGFDPSTVPEGVGIASMRASVGVLGGTLVVASTPGSGTTVSARLGPTEPRLTAEAESPSLPTPHLRLVRSSEVRSGSRGGAR